MEKDIVEKLTKGLEHLCKKYMFQIYEINKKYPNVDRLPIIEFWEELKTICDKNTYDYLHDINNNVDIIINTPLNILRFLGSGKTIWTEEGNWGRIVKIIEKNEKDTV